MGYADKTGFVQKLVDIDLFSDIRRIEDALNRKSCTEALAWCSENKAALRKLKVTNLTESRCCKATHIFAFADTSLSAEYLRVRFETAGVY